MLSLRFSLRARLLKQGLWPRTYQFTLRVKTDTGAEYVLQRINQYVFKDPVRLMANVGAVTAYLKERSATPGRRSIFFLRRMESSTMWMRRGSIGGCMTS